MKVLQAIETGGPGGAERVLLALCSGLAARGHEVEVVLLKDGWLAERLDERGVPRHTLSLRGGWDRAFVRELGLVAVAREADVLHTHEFSLTWYGRRAARAGGFAHVGTIHGKNFVDRLKQRLAAGLQLRPHAKTDLVAVSDDLARWVSARALPPLPALGVVRNGVPMPEGIAVRERRGERLEIVSVGNLYPVKNHALAIDAVALLHERGVPARWTVLGRGGELDALRERARSRGIEERVEFAGFRDDVGTHLAAADVFLSTSRSEGMPLSFLEAMGHALPVVASAVGGVPEIVADGRTGLLFPCGDASAAADALERIARDEPLRRKLALEALDDARSRGSDDAMVEAYLRRYEELVGGSGESSGRS